LAAIALLCALSSCMTIEGDLRVDADDTMSGAFVVAVDRSALEASNTSEDVFLSRMDEVSGKLRIPASQHARAEPYVTSTQVGRRYVYSKVPLRDFNSSGGWQIKHDGHWFVVNGEVDFSGIADQPGIDPAEVAKSWNVIVRITFPGEVQFANGQIDSRSVTWQPAFGQKTSLTAGAEDRPPSGFQVPELGKLTGPALALLLAGAAAEITVVVVAAMLVRRRRRRPPPVRGRRALVKGAPARPGQVLVGTIIERSQYERAQYERSQGELARVPYRPRELEPAQGDRPRTPRPRGAHRQSR